MLLRITSLLWAYRIASPFGTSFRSGRSLLPRAFTSSPASSSSLLMATQDELKKQVGYKAVDDYVTSGMVVGLGTGSTAAFAVERVGILLKSGELKDIVAIPTSVRTKEQAEELGIPLTTLGTPESRFSKLPVEIAPFCWEHTMRAISELPSLAGGKPQLRLGSSANNAVDGEDPAVTDNGLYIVDIFFDAPIKDAPKAAADLKATCGVFEHGLFCGMTTSVIIAGSDGISEKKA